MTDETVVGEEDIDDLLNLGLAVVRREIRHLSGCEAGLNDDGSKALDRYVRCLIMAKRVAGPEDMGGHTPEELEAIARGEPIARRKR